MIPVIINNRDLLTWPKAMVSKLKTLDNVGEIFIVDNGSTYQPLLDWYETKPCTLIKVDNLGHSAPWKCGLVEKLNGLYVVSDPDLDLKDLPSDTLTYLSKKLNNNQSLGKVGLKLDWESVPQNSSFYKIVYPYETKRWKTSKIVDEVYTDIHVDTTFALYKYKHYFIGGGSVNSPYVARHLPWDFTEQSRLENKEFQYYIKHASNSSSYKVFLKL